MAAPITNPRWPVVLARASVRDLSVSSTQLLSAVSAPGPLRPPSIPANGSLRPAGQQGAGSADRRTEPRTGSSARIHSWAVQHDSWKDRRVMDDSPNGLD